MRGEEVVEEPSTGTNHACLGVRVPSLVPSKTTPFWAFGSVSLSLFLNMGLTGAPDVIPMSLTTYRFQPTEIFSVTAASTLPTRKGKNMPWKSELIGKAGEIFLSKQ